jgi:hypothetical protein
MQAREHSAAKLTNLINRLEGRNLAVICDSKSATSTEGELQRGVYTLQNTAIKYTVNNYIIERVNIFNYLGHTITVTNSRDSEIKMIRLNEVCNTVRRTLSDKKRKQTQIKFYNAVAVPTLTYRSDMWTITKL